jgi:cytochrome c
VSRRRTCEFASTFVLVVVGCGGCEHPVPSLAGTDVERGRAALERFECSACHVIPGIRGAESFVGPPLDGFGRRVQFAGRFANTPEALVRWLVDPPAMKADTAMPAVGLGERDARDIAAYLYTLE